MNTITTHEAKTHLSKLLAQVEHGEEFIITRGKHPVAHLVPLDRVPKSKRPRVGETLGPLFDIPAAALAPLSEEELREDWGL